jgi:hypothetical protein
MSKIRIVAALVDCKIVGKRSSRTMRYTHALVIQEPGETEWRLRSCSQSERGAHNLLAEFKRYYSGWPARVVPVVAIDKKGDILPEPTSGDAP